MTWKDVFNSRHFSWRSFDACRRAAVISGYRFMVWVDNRVYEVKSGRPYGYKLTGFDFVPE